MLRIALVIALLAPFAALQAEEAHPLALTPQETYELTQARGDTLLFIDVRDPVEIMFTGFTDVVDLNIPLELADPYDFVEERAVFRMNRNPDFIAQVDAALAAKGLGRDDLIITMCRSGSARGLPSAEFLLESGFTNVKFVDHGFQGDTQSEGEQQGMRTLNGWQNAGLPWSNRANPDKMFRPVR
ncbi:MAG: sulfurtransferase [Marinobacter sp.]|nr:sulfurtransferase [Marinobacter sp.]